MQPQSIDSRVEGLEQRMDALAQLPARMNALEEQISQFRAEVRDEFSAIRGEIREGDEETRRILRGEIREGDEETRRMLRGEIRETGDRILNQGRVLYEDLKAQLALIQEGIPLRRKRRPRE